VNAADEPTARLPFCRQTVLVPRRHRGAAVSGMALAAPSRPAVVRLHRLLAQGIRSVGAWWLPRGPQVPWPDWMGADEAMALLEDLRSCVGRFDALALHTPRQAGRRTLALLLLDDGHPRAFVKVKPEGAALDLEADVVTALVKSERAPIVVAQPVARGSCGVHWLATSAIAGPHAPRLLEPGPTYEAWLDECLEPVLDRGSTPPHWRPAHGDLAPWNLRTSGPATWLVDWESAAYAPPDADRTYFRAALAVLRRRRPAAGSAEAVEYWRKKVAARGTDEDLNRRLLEVLSHMGAEGGDG
jgi:hypothetical protein